MLSCLSLETRSAREVSWKPQQKKRLLQKLGEGVMLLTYPVTTLEYLALA